MLLGVLKRLGRGAEPVGSAVYKHLVQTGKPRVREVMPPTPTTFKPRMSGVPYLCERQVQLQIRAGVVWLQSESPSDIFTLGTGHAMHTMMQDSVLPAILQDRMRGWWRRNDGKVDSGVAPSEPGPCGTTRERPILYGSTSSGTNGEDEYIEVSVGFSSLYGLTGHPDMVIDWTGSGIEGVPDAPEVQEYKTINESEFVFKKVDPSRGGKPSRAHVIQVTGYMAALGLEHGRVSYLWKGKNDPKDALKAEWSIPYDEGVFRRDVVETIQSAAAAVKTAGEGALAERHWCCTSAQTWKAKKCPMRNECWQIASRKKRPIRMMTPEERKAWEASWQAKPSPSTLPVGPEKQPDQTGQPDQDQPGKGAA